MRFNTAALTLLVSNGIVSALPGGGEGGKHHGKGHLTSSCWTSSTCQATYYTSTETKTKPVTVTSTKTVVKPVEITTEVESTYLSTSHVTSTVYVTSVYTETSKVPYKTYSTICKTIPVETYSESEVEETKTIPHKTIINDIQTLTTEVPSVIHTSSAYPSTITSVSYSTYTSLCPGSSTKCETQTGWKTWTAYGGGW